MLIHGGIVITMDPSRRVLHDASVILRNGRIAEILPKSEARHRLQDQFVIDATGKVVMPGLIDLHGYLGGSILKSLGEDLDGTARRNFLEDVLSRATDAAWWEIEAQLSAAERLKLGTTTMFSMMGGNGTRTDTAAFPQIAARELERVGMRARIGLGPARPPWPRTYSYTRDGAWIERDVSFEEVISACDDVLSRWRASPGPLVDYCVALSRIGNRNEHDPVWTPEREKWIRIQADAAIYLMRRHDVGFWTHMYGNSVDYAWDEKLGLLGPRSILSHCSGITERSIEIIRETGSHAAHHPRAARLYSYPGRCPLPEMIDAGIVVGLGADAPQNHDVDMFLDMKAAIALQRHHFKDPRMMPPGKVLEMATIDGARALGLEHEIGSVEVGKKADLLTVDLAQPYLGPVDMPVHRVVYHATGRDVCDVIVDGQLLVQDRHLKTIDERTVMASAAEMYAKVCERTGIDRQPKSTDRLWGSARA
jgi:cytosine/adenosine deaminase-related metal-dependent hydrolase